MDIQGLIDAFNESARIQRGGYHVLLGKMIDRLNGAPDHKLVKIDRGGFPGEAMSYRGYYDDLCFAPSDTPVNVSGFRAVCNGALGRSYEGYKGGDFIMGADTPLWIAPHSCCGQAIIDVREEDDALILVTKDID